METMKQLARIFSKPPSFDENLLLPMIDNARPFDIQEKKKLVRALEEMHTEKHRLWRRVMLEMLRFYLFCVFYNLIQVSTSDPWKLVEHAYYMKKMRPLVTSSDFWAMGMCIKALVDLGMNSEPNREKLLLFLYGGFTFAVIWVYFVYRLPEFRWDVIWLPCGPLSVCVAGLCVHLERLLSELSEQLRKLRRYMDVYNAM